MDMYWHVCVVCLRACVCVSALKSRDSDSGSAVIPGAPMRLARADRSGGFMSNRVLLGVCVCVCVHLGFSVCG